MAGSAELRRGGINPADIVEVRERVRIDEVIAEHLTLRSAGPGSLKGLCPFHEERSPSFHVTPGKGLYYCFGCGAGGDAIDFLMAMEHLTFTEAVEKLAGRVGLTLRYEGGGPGLPGDRGQRSRLLAVNAAAAEFFSQELRSAAAVPARRFLSDRGFDAPAWQQFGLGYAPRRGLVAHLRQHGFSHDSMVESGVAGFSEGRLYDRFRERLIWPIRDVSGDVVGFGARRLAEDSGPKYLNTPETPVYKKSRVLYGVYEARRAIAKEQEVVVVEGYTDVMACHLAGVPTAVATCGTAFGPGHVKQLRRLLMDNGAARVVFTFDGDAAGRQAALRAYEEDQQFAARTFVAIARDGMDPCDVRLRFGEKAVRALVDERVPLFEFVLRSGLADLDLRTAEGRVNGLRVVAPVVAGIKDQSLRQEYARQVAGWLGVETERVLAAARRNPRSVPEPRGDRQTPAARVPPQPGAERLPLERLSLQVILQVPELVAEWRPRIEATAFTDPELRGVHEALARVGEAHLTGPAWIRAVVDACADDGERSLVRRLVSLPLPADPPTEAFAVGVVAHLLYEEAGDRAADLRAALGDPTATDQRQALADLMAIEDYRRTLKDHWAGEE